MAGNQVVLEFAGDSSSLSKASKTASDAVADVGKSSTGASEDMAKTSKESGGLLDKFSKLGNSVSGASDAIDDASGALTALNQVQQAGYEKAQRLARASNDVAQAQEDANQAQRDGKQAGIDAQQAQVDLTQAQLDGVTAHKAYLDAVKKDGEGSAAAQQALIDYRQTTVDVQQAKEDGAQATRDASQATIDATGAQLDLNDAQREANPPDLEKWAQNIEMYAPLLQGLVGITGLVTAAQWLWNAAQAASPTTWIILGIVALVAIIVIIATKTKWFQTIWRVAWSGIKTAAEATWNFIKKIPGWIGSAFSRIGSAISSPFRAAFNWIADAWNNTVGRLNWTVPGWVPGIGGNSIGVPHIPHFHEGGTVPGTPGSGVLALLQGGEEVTSVTGSGRGDGDLMVTVTLDSDVLLTGMAKRIKKRGGNVQMVLGSTRG